VRFLRLGAAYWRGWRSTGLEKAMRIAKPVVLTEDDRT